MVINLYDHNPLEFAATRPPCPYPGSSFNHNSVFITDDPKSKSGVRLWLNAQQAAQLRACLDELYPPPLPAEEPHDPDTVLIHYADEHAGEFQPSLCSMINPNAPLPLTPVEVDLLAERIAGRNTP